MISKKELARMVDHTNLRPYATAADMKKLCDEAIKYGFGMVAINPAQVKRCKEFLKGTDIHVGAAIGFPLGQTTIATKVFETEDAIKNGADEIDYVINITELKEKNYAYVEEEMQKIVDVCRKYGVIVKVIFENCFLTKNEIRKMSEIALKVRPDYVKTSTGWGSGGAKMEDIEQQAASRPLIRPLPLSMPGAPDWELQPELPFWRVIRKKAEIENLSVFC